MKIYFMGICGTAMGNAALLLRECGHEVLGADSGIYPPMSTELERAGIAILEGYDPQRLAGLAPDLVVVGNAQSRGNPELEWLLEERALPFTSLPELLNRFILSRRDNIVISGTHGKTTTTAMTACALRQGGGDAGWLVGGVPRDLPGGAHLGAACAPFVIEGDEYDSAFFDKRSKFIHYAPRILVINNVEMDHADIFRDLTDVLRTFRHVMRIVPGKGWILANGDDANVMSLLPAPWTRVLKVGTGEGCDLRITGFAEGPQGAHFHLTLCGRTLPVSLRVGGLFNARNAAMAILASALALAGRDATPDSLDLRPGITVLAQFRGVHRRQEEKFRSGRVAIIEDFGHHPTALAATLDSLRAANPGMRVVAAFEPRSNTAVTNLFQAEFTAALEHADACVIGPVHRPGRLAPQARLDTAAMAQAINAAGRTAHAACSNTEVLQWLKNAICKPDTAPTLVCIFSNGSFDGIVDSLVACAGPEGQDPQ